MKKLRALVADDSLTVRRRLVAALEADGGFAVVGEAADGEAAFARCAALRPDIMTLDMMMPKCTGLTVTERVMAFCPTPILIVSAADNRGDALRPFDAVAAGAVDVLEKPRWGDDDAWDRRFVSAAKLVARIKVITHVRGKKGAASLSSRPPPPLSAASGAVSAVRSSRRATSATSLIAVGASTGGPAALVAALGPLPSSFPVPILLVLHLSAAFGEAFAAWLGGRIAIPVSQAADGAELPRVGTPGVLVAPADRHLAIRDRRLWLTTDPERHSCRPSVDVLFESVAAEIGDEAIGCLLTGMGRDGAEGLLAMKRAGAITIAQDESSCVVFGMPKEAIALDAAQIVVPAGEIGPALSVLTERRRG